MSLLKPAMSSVLTLPSNGASHQTLPPWPQRRTLKAIPLASKVVRYDAGHGQHSHVTIEWRTGIHNKDTTTRTISPLQKPMCLTKEEVRGQKVEREVILPQALSDLNIIPGGIFDSQELLRSGEFKYLGWHKRKPYTITIGSTLAKQTSATVSTQTSGGLSESAAAKSIQSLLASDNFFGTPNRSPSSEMQWSTFQEGMGMGIGGSFFYLGLSGAQPFSFSSEKYRFLYVYTFEQLFFTASPNYPGSPENLFNDSWALNEDALFLQEVKYGRRLYIIIESEYGLEKCSNELDGSLEWIVISAKLQQAQIAKAAREHIRIRIQAQDGTSFVVSDYTQLQKVIDTYFQSTCAENPICPLSYKVNDLQGTPVCLVTTAFLEGQHCLTSPKARVFLREIKVCGDKKSGHTFSEEIYGSVNLHLYNEFGTQIQRNGQFIEPLLGLGRSPTGTIMIAKKDSPLKLVEGSPQEFGANEQGKYIDVDITSLDMTFQIEPIIKEKVDSGDNELATTTEMKKKLRQMLIEGSTETTFQCRHDKCLLELTVDIKPL